MNTSDSPFDAAFYTFTIVHLIILGLLYWWLGWWGVALDGFIAFIGGLIGSSIAAGELSYIMGFFWGAASWPRILVVLIAIGGALFRGV